MRLNCALYFIYHSLLFIVKVVKWRYSGLVTHRRQYTRQACWSCIYIYASSLGNSTIIVLIFSLFLFCSCIFYKSRFCSFLSIVSFSSQMDRIDMIDGMLLAELSLICVSLHDFNFLLLTAFDCVLKINTSRKLGYN